MPFAEEFINAFLAGQQARENKQTHEARQRELQYQAEDRDVEKQLLKHRLTELKLQERLHAREAAKSNLAALSGQSISDAAPSTLEEAAPPPYQGGGLGDQQGAPPFQMRPVNIPGIPGDLLGGVDIPDINVRPDTREQQLADILAEARLKASTTLHPIARGGGLATGLGEVLIKPQEVAAPRVPLVKIRQRDARGKLIERNVPADSPEALQPQELQPLPKSSTSITLPDTEFNDYIDGVMSGRTPVSSIPKSTVGMRARARLSKLGFNETQAINDEKAIAAHYQSMNSQTMNDLRLSADTVTNALDDLEMINDKWDRTTLGPFSMAGISKLLGTANGAQARDADEAIRAITQALPMLENGGSAPTNQALTDARKLLSSSDSKVDLGAAIKRLRKSVAYRTAAIGKLEAVTASGGVPGAPTSTAPPPSAVPPEVAAVLANEKPGKITLSDGSVWIKTPDGRIAPAK